MQQDSEDCSRTAPSTVSKSNKGLPISDTSSKPKWWVALTCKPCKAEQTIDSAAAKKGNKSFLCKGWLAPAAPTQ